MALGAGIWPHGRWRVELPGEANHAGTTALDDRHDAMLGYARLVLAARTSAAQHSAVATCGKVQVQPNGVNAIPSLVTAWLDARAPDEHDVRVVVDELTALTMAEGGRFYEESWTGRTTFDASLLDAAARCARATFRRCRRAPATMPEFSPPPALPTAMIFVRNPTGVSHSPAEYAERTDCLAGIEALGAVSGEARWMTWYSANHAFLPGGVAADVRIEVADGRIAAVERGSGPAGATSDCPDSVMPGFANTHSHAFHRALRGRTHESPRGRTGHVLDVAETRCTTCPVGSTPTTTSLWRGRRTRRWRSPA